MAVELHLDAAILARQIAPGAAAQPLHEVPRFALGLQLGGGGGGPRGVVVLRWEAAQHERVRGRVLHGRVAGHAAPRRQRVELLHLLLVAERVGPPAGHVVQALALHLAQQLQAAVGRAGQFPFLLLLLLAAPGVVRARARGARRAVQRVGLHTGDLAEEASSVEDDLLVGGGEPVGSRRVVQERRGVRFEDVFIGEQHVELCPSSKRISLAAAAQRGPAAVSSHVISYLRVGQEVVVDAERAAAGPGSGRGAAPDQERRERLGGWLHGLWNQRVASSPVFLAVVGREEEGGDHELEKSSLSAAHVGADRGRGTSTHPRGQTVDRERIETRTGDRSGLASGIAGILRSPGSALPGNWRTLYRQYHNRTDDRTDIRC
ncbi:hypothetical protein VTN02DRAFT_2443 [Thermoascus thermophilus]